jgi:hypothetical protein
VALEFFTEVQIMPKTIVKPDFELTIRKAPAFFPPDGSNNTIVKLIACLLGFEFIGKLDEEARFFETATMLNDGTINLQYAAYHEEGELLEGFETRKPDAIGYQEIIDRHHGLKPGETSFLQRSQNGKTIVSNPLSCLAKNT